MFISICKYQEGRGESVYAMSSMLRLPSMLSRSGNVELGLCVNGWRQQDAQSFRNTNSTWRPYHSG